MTTNKPEVFWVYRTRYGEPESVVSLSDYEALQAEYEKLRKDAELKHAALEREVEALRSLLSDVTCVAITMLYNTHKQDVLDEFTMDDLKEVVRRSEHLQIEKVEHIYRRGFEALAAGEA